MAYTPTKVLQEWFPHLKKNRAAAKLTSPLDQFYNCVAWALGDSSMWWEPATQVVPFTHWPTARGDYSIGAYVAMFVSQGFEQCADGSRVDDQYKIVLYVAPNGDFTHVAKQTLNPKPGWSSKCGRASDIWHETPEVLEGADYGKVWGYLQRRTST